MIEERTDMKGVIVGIVITIIQVVIVIWLFTIGEPWSYVLAGILGVLAAVTTYGAIESTQVAPRNELGIRVKVVDVESDNYIKEEDSNYGNGK